MAKRTTAVSLYMLMLSHTGCQKPCNTLECSGDRLTSTIKVFLQATSNRDVRTIPTMEIQGPQSYGYDWSYQVEQSNPTGFWIGVPNHQSIHYINWQFGTVELSSSTLSSSSQLFGESLQVSGEYAIVGIPAYQQTYDHSGGIEIWNLTTNTRNSMIEGTLEFQQLPKTLWRCEDLDNDGVQDWIASDLGDGNSGQIWLGLSQIWLTIDSNATITDFPHIQGGLSEEAFGHHVLCDTDWNLDGNIDLTVSSPFANINGQNGAGRISIWLNDGHGNFTSSVLSINGTTKEGWLGYRLASGDVDGDGFLELAATTFESDNTAVQFYTFRETYWQERYRLRPRKPDTFWGYDVELADINGDQLDDVVVSAPLADSLQYNNAGVIEIYPGTTNLLDWIDGPQEIIGTERNQRLGTRVSTADLNQDGILDIVAQGYRTVQP